MTSCFVSYTSSDSAWAEWIAGVLRAAGYDVVLQLADFRPGENFVLKMQDASAGADHTIAVLSARYLASQFASAEWAAAFAADPTGSRRTLIPVAVERIAPGGLWGPIVRVELAGRSEREARELLLGAIGPQRPSTAPAFPAQRQPGRARGGYPEAVEVWRLPVATGSLVGRDDELAMLDAAWERGDTNVLTIVAWGGVGKTTLLNHWLARMAGDGYRGADRVYAWSFYRQSESGQLDTADQFLDAALTWFDAEPLPASSMWERCRRLAAKLQESRTLLILDGIEGLQHPPGQTAGAIKDPVLMILVRELAAFNRGLCIITSRLPVADIAPFIGQTCTEVLLGSLTQDAGAALLHRVGVVGDEDRLRALSAQVEGHALTLTLLGNYIRTVFGGDVTRWNPSRLSRAARRGGSPVTRVMQEYDRWFGGQAEGQMLALIGLFDRPAPRRQLLVLRERPVVPGLNDQLVDLDDEEWAYVADNLRNAGLLMAASDDRSSLDAHPLVRQHYRERHAREHPAAHLEGHRRLFEYLQVYAVQRPGTLVATLPLVAAVWHGSQAGLTGPAVREVYWPRIAQDCHHLRDVLGAASSNHEVLGYVLAEYERDPSVLSDLELARVLCEQALDLRMMGRAADAVEPFERAIVLAGSADDPSAAANAGRHLSQLYLALGRLGDGVRACRRAVQAAADLPAAHLERVACAATLGDIEHQRGDLVAAHSMFVAGGLSSDSVAELGRHHVHRVTFYISLYRYCDLLVSLYDSIDDGPVEGLSVTRAGLVREVRLVTSRGRELNEAGRRITLARALMTLAAGRIAVASASDDELDPAALDETVDELRRVGQRPWLLHSLLSRASLLRTTGQFDGAARDLREARSVAAADGTILQHLDCELESALFELATGNEWQTRLLTDSLSAKAHQIGYGRLTRRLAAMRARLL